MIRRLQKLWPLGLVVFLLSACGRPSDLSQERTGIWTKYFVGPLSDTLDWFAHLLWGEYGLSILVMTIIIRTIILPLTLRQYKSSKGMQALQPELEKLKKKYKDDPKKQQEETMLLFQKNGVNPLAGCFPILIQMPILIALYNAIMYNPYIHEHTFLWLQLSQKDPYYILPILASITTFVQQKVMMSLQPNQSNPSMNMLLYIFPVMIFVMSMSFASALPLYWVFSNIFTIVQNYFIYRPSKK
ncbi:membrane protein insertase YidC [Paenibacillus mesotrionivorans]|uniref:Membrane protein insertase YidC n=1 Tax=Paenibacillus mesotrionivorans TaxID=3160968 RepID=A0ACC7P2X8_9BACL